MDKVSAQMHLLIGPDIQFMWSMLCVLVFEEDGISVHSYESVVRYNQPLS